MKSYNEFIEFSNWSIELVKGVEKILKQLLDPRHAQSLERLQLLDIEGKHTVDQVAETGVTKNDEFVIVCGQVKVQEMTYDLRIRYFNRGQRKYFKHTIPQDCASSREVFQPNLGDIENFFKKFGQTTDFFWRADFLKLTGQSSPPVPAFFLMALTLTYLERHRTGPHDITSFACSFERTAFVNEAISLASSGEAECCAAIASVGEQGCVRATLSL